jgi:hypothetical protein
MNRAKNILVVLLTLCLFLSSSFPVLAAPAAAAPVTLEKALKDTGAYLLKKVQSPRVGSVGGEWALIGLARSGLKVPAGWYTAYYQSLEDEIVKNQGVLPGNKYTEYSRAILALTAIGKNPADVGGYDLLARLGDFDNVFRQGINGPLFALLAFDAWHHVFPDHAGEQIQVVRERLLGAITELQLADGGFSLGGRTGDADVTAMALQALAPYQERAEIKKVIERALTCLSRLQNSDGSYTSYWEAANVEGVTQVLIALTALGIDPVADARFIKNGNTVVDHLLHYFVPGGGFKHILTQSEPDAMATEQAFCGLVAYDRFLKGKTGLYEMSDVQVSAVEQNAAAAGLPGKDPAVTARPVCNPGKTFADIKGLKEQAAIEALAARGIISGVSDLFFEPGRTMTRAEFAALVVRALGLAPAGGAVFADVAATSWYADAVATAHAYGIVHGTSETTFTPGGTITREQAAAMIAQSARLCGLHTAPTATEIRDLLAQFPDYTSCSAWAGEPLAFCYQQAILSAEVLHIKPQEAITRAEIAAMVYRMLQKAALG